MYVCMYVFDLFKIHFTYNVTNLTKQFSGNFSKLYVGFIHFISTNSYKKNFRLKALFSRSQKRRAHLKFSRGPPRGPKEAINFINENLLRYHDTVILSSDRNTLYHKYNFVVWLEDMAHDGASSY